ncbi:cytochrome p450 [Colletotrichum incanum]|uniref:Cytochrome p450 n=1 Tax=Colletotrichum incanum TaxID=1573173 RepID=A0A166ZSB1_COLIC|nr:cytochrome p450 [Colletotrichum incanum]
MHPTVLSVFLYTLYQYLLPKPIPGIPYNKEAAQSLLGDIYRLQKESPNKFLTWIIEQSRRSGSPIFQVWLGPFQKPSVVIADFREGQDILMRRKEFDRADFSRDILSGEARSFHIVLKNGPQWKAQRRLLQDLMTPAFLHRVAAPEIYKGALRLLELWAKKIHIANGRPFAAENDIFYSALDAILDFGFGDATPIRALTPQIAKISSLSNAQVQLLREAVTDEKRFDFPVAPIDPVLETSLQAAENISRVASTGFPKLAWSVIGLMPSVRRGRIIRSDFIKDQILQAVERLKTQGKNQGDSNVKSAIDLMVQREEAIAENEGRHAPNWLGILTDEVRTALV